MLPLHHVIRGNRYTAVPAAVVGPPGPAPPRGTHPVGRRPLLVLPPADPWDGHPAPAPPQAPRYPGTQQDPAAPRGRDWSSGFKISFPLWPPNGWNEVDGSMKRYLVMAICIGLLICMVLIVIIIGAFLPPGMVDPYTHEVRFISDGFKDYPILPILCLGPVALLGVIYTAFARYASKATSRVSQQETVLVFVSGAVSWVGFFLVQHHADGTAHFIGAAMFMVFHALMQHFIDNILFNVRHGTGKDRAIEHGITAIMLVAGAVFFGAMVVKWIAQGSFKWASISATAEYLVFASFVAINLYGMSAITYIASNYTAVNSQSSGVKWVLRPL